MYLNSGQGDGGLAESDTEMSRSSAALRGENIFPL